MKRSIPLFDETAPIACTIDPADIPERLATIERMRTDLARLERTEHGLLLHFAHSSDREAELRQFAKDEKRCCQFWGFEVRPGSDTGLALQWDAPPNAAALIDTLQTFFEGDEPAEVLRSLL
jgi:hypothetical protein